VDQWELALMETDDEKTQLAYAEALSEYADAGGYDVEVTWDVCTVKGLGVSYDKAKYRELRTLSGGEQKRLVLEYLLAGPDEVLLLDEPDNFLDVPGKIWLEQRIRESDKTILFISHDRELLDNTATRVVTVELGHAGNLVWTHPGGFSSYHEARKDRFARFEELRRRWDEDHAKIKALVLRLKIKSEYNDGMSSQYRAAQTRLRKFEEAGPPTEQPREQQVTMRLKGGRTGKRAVVCEDLELTGLMRPFDLEVWYGERVAVLGSNGSGKSHFLRLLAAGGTDPDVEHQPVGDVHIQPVPHTGKAKLGARVRPGWFVQTHDHPELTGRTLLDILHRGDGSPSGRAGMGREQAARVLDRYELAHGGEQRFESLSGGQQARFQILLLELSGATLLLLDEPTDNLDVQSAEALEEGLEAFDGTVVAVTHDRWFARGFDRFLVYGADGEVYESDGPVWDEGRVQRVR
jgi:ATPase subunit of ABC transporter with duplicated ATPase domains